MQSGREDTLEAQYAIKFCVKLGKNATQTYELLQTAYGLTCMGRASVFRWHKKFQGGRESVRDDERCGRGREVRTPELVKKIRTFVDEDRRVSIETISEQFEISTKFVPRVLSDEQKERRDSREMVELINSDPRVLMALVTCDESWIYCYGPETKRQFPVQASGLPQTQEGQTE
ncbi:protein GVQW3-like [Penaeus monodon]|uniref:protein GVQW3-like n=1 Tax=Penaeus monodon TaxID=6687 RepID=UPI0018A6E258|nr:protein GVQW3-like [Penaeus monodon]